MSRKLVLLDLDGTLVDSAPAILSALQAACASCDVTPVVPLDSTLIGPPLRVMIERTAGTTDDRLVARLEQAFRNAYDLDGYRHTMPYPLLHEVLHELHAAGHALALVTNKRRVPTVKILDLLDVAHAFDAVLTVDSFPPDPLSKAQLVARAIRDASSASHATTMMVGDTEDDHRAAIANAIPFVAATYGYGFRPSDAVVQKLPVIAALADLPSVLGRLA